ncbi:alkane 1-monooxygenase [Ideonella dechloratans]|uniref:Alkane 1-monooxygenase n=1 Tax=Ideonella dechloratans TaxID=36863 RepID=A0A643F7Y7_IDEDE|nr:alkane 1-monooxygenase [Ideonella dechloratans]KAB0577036.1 alkane 1-monooxygenase [Ideonella dechloratans]UFU08497.1 alkane 1-monooxygenase [Ideonella dechloratans]
MSTSTAPSSDRPPIYRDPKRHAWLLSLLVPLSIGAGPLMWTAHPSHWVLWVPTVFVYLVAPLLDLLLGTDSSNPPEPAVPALEADPYYRWVTYALVPLLWLGFIFAAWFSQQPGLSTADRVALVLATGGVGGFCINLGHELGHKRTTLERWLAKLILAPTFYGHFTIEHNRGHHRDVATPEDPASSRMGESIWRFVWREMPGAWRRAWALERARTRADGQAVWSLHNEILQPMLVGLALWAALVLWLGPQVLLFLLPTALWANFQLTSANYVEHYGLLRQKTPQGRYEPCQPRHSWNSNHLFSNWATFHLQRHSDHHAHPLRRYQSLRHFDEAPQLPCGYFGLFPVAYLPPLWFALMDRRLVESVGRDPDRINFDPRRRTRLMARHGLAQPAPASPHSSASDLPARSTP